MKLNKGSLVIESLIAMIVCAFIIEAILGYEKLLKLESDIYVKYEERVYEP